MANQYRVEIDGKTVWEGKGDSPKVIPAEYRDRPADGDPAHYLYEKVGRNEECLYGVQASFAEEGN